MFGKGSKIYAMITGCCPKCHEESMYIDGNPFNVMKIYAMHDKCSHCGQVYKIEPSFFFGAMFVSYGLGVGIGIITFLIAHYLFQTTLKTSFIWLISFFSLYLLTVAREKNGLSLLSIPLIK